MAGQVHTIQIERNRYSVTQGSVRVKFDGKYILTYDDEIKLIGSDDSWCGAKGRPTYGENIGGWASIHSDDYYLGMLFSEFFPLGSASVAERVKAVLEEERKEGGKAA